MIKKDDVIRKLEQMYNRKSYKTGDLLSVDPYSNGIMFSWKTVTM